MFFRNSFFPFFILFTGIFLQSCETVNLYEKNISVPKHAWSSQFKPEFRFIIEDTTVNYNLFVVLRHNEKYNYNNIWLRLTTRIPGDTSVRKVQYELPLANSSGWLTTSSMDDLYEHRILLTPGNEGLPLRKAGEYIFTLEQVMREDPLENILNVGLRIEKKTP